MTLETRPAVDVIATIDRIAVESPTRACFVFEGNVLDYAEVRLRSDQVAGTLARAGLRRVAVLSPNCALAMVATLGIIRAGATWLPLNPRDAAAHTARLLTNFECDALLFHSSFEPLLADLQAHAPSIQTVVCIDRDMDGTPGLSTWAAEQVADCPDRDPDAIAAIFATGGTTGEPRGVCFRYSTLSFIAQAMSELLHQSHPDPVFLASAPLTHVSGRVCLGVLAAGGTTVILPKFDAAAVLRAIPEHRVTFMLAPPTMLTMLLREPAVESFDFSSLRWLGTGAAPVPVDLLKRAIEVFGPIVLQAYGQTEAPMFITRKQLGDDVIAGLLAPDARLRSCGRATAYSELRILGPELQPLGPGEVGEIAVRGDFVMDGYYNDPVATASTRADDFHRTGDLGFLDSDGFLTITGRTTDMIISGGFNVFPAEVEDALMERPEIAEAAVFGIPDATWGEVVVAAVMPAADSTVDPAAVIDFARDRLGGVKAPKRVIVVDDLPRNDNGKVLKRMLVEWHSHGD